MARVARALDGVGDVQAGNGLGKVGDVRQGVGDELMFAGLIPDLQAAGPRCLLECDRRLVSLFRRSFPQVEIVRRRTPADLYTYTAALDYVIDGDTVVCEVDVGFRTWTRQKLRLRGIDAPELATPQGKRAKKRLQAKLTAARGILIKTYAKDKYDRYLVDIFLGRERLFVNRWLVDQGLAILY